MFFILRIYDDETGKIYTREDIINGNDLKDEPPHKKINDTFTIILCKECKPLFDGKLSGTSLTKYIYLSTYIEYGTNRLICKNKKPITRYNINRVLNISNKSVYSFLRELREKDMVHLDSNGVIYMDNKYILKGTPKNKKGEYKYIKIYHKPIRELYEGTKSGDKIILSYIFLSIPYINDTYNLICMNPSEVDLKLIKTPSNLELAHIWSYSKANISFLRKRLQKLRVSNSLDIVLNIISDKDKSKNKIMINPFLMRPLDSIAWSPKISSPQSHIAEILNGELNYRLGKYFLDIFLANDNICIEYDGSGHDLSVLMGMKSKEEFKEEEQAREDFILNNGIKIIRLISKTDNLPKDDLLINIINKCIRDVQKYGIIKYDLDRRSFT